MGNNLIEQGGRWRKLSALFLYCVGSNLIQQAEHIQLTVSSWIFVHTSFMTTETNEEFSVNGEELLKKVKELIDAGNARRIIIKNDKDVVLIEIPLAIGALGAVLLPALAAVGAIAALVTKCTIVVVKK